jgi:hypothetical protein
MAGSANATGHFHINGDVILKGLGPRSVKHGGEPCRLILAQGLQSFKLHVTALQRPLVVCANPLDVTRRTWLCRDTADFIGLFAVSIRTHLGVPDEMELLFGISLGHHDPAGIAAAPIVPREPISNSCILHD